jgi:EmrB/QacA subfamily drug resistance transporter
MSISDIQKAALTVAVAGSFVTPFVGSSINVALPAIGKEFGMDAVLLSWVATSFLLAAAAFLVPLGRLGDIWGRKRVYSWGMVIFTAASLIAACSTSGWMLLVCRTVQGIGSAMIFSTGMAILTSVFPVSQRGWALGVNVASVYIGLSLGPFIGGLITEHWSWRGVFLINVPVGLMAILLTILILKGEWADAEGERFDIVGSLVYGASLSALMYGVSTVPQVRAVWLIAAGVCGILFFIHWETHHASPVFDVNLFRNNRVFALSSLAALLNYSATFAVTFLMSLYLQHVQGLSPRTAGLVLITQPAVMALFSPFAGRISDRIEPRIVASVGMGFTVAGLLGLTFLASDSNLGYVLACLVVLGIGFGLFSSPNANAIMSSVDQHSYGIASGAVGTMRLLGQMLSMGVATLVFAVFIGRVQITQAYHSELVQSTRCAFFIFAVLCTAGILASLARGTLRDDAKRRSQ